MFKIGIFGVSASGKSTFASYLKSKYPNIISYSASTLIKQAQGVVSFSEIDSDSLKNNQYLLLESIGRIERVVGDDDIFVIELHAYLEKDDLFIEIDNAYLSAIGLSAIVLLELDPYVIFQRRKSSEKIRPNNCPEFIGRIQTKAREKLKSFSSTESILLFTDLELFEKFIASIYKN